MINIYQFTSGEHIKLILILKSFTLLNEFDFTRIFSFQLQIFSLSAIFNPLSSLSFITYSSILYAKTLSKLIFIYGSISFHSRHNLSRSLYFHKFQVPDQFFWNLKINYVKYSYGISISSCGIIFLFSSFSFSRIFVIGTDFSTMLLAWSRFICTFRLSNTDIHFYWSISGWYFVWLTLQMNYVLNFWFIFIYTRIKMR